MNKKKETIMTEKVEKTELHENAHRLYASYFVDEISADRNGVKTVKRVRKDKKINEVIISLVNAYNNFCLTDGLIFDIIAAPGHQDMLARVLNILTKHGIDAPVKLIKNKLVGKRDGLAYEQMLMVASFNVTEVKLPSLDILLARGVTNRIIK